ncbi:GNAT family N-acetyltransferase [Deinococcus arboris]|uniref:GNAT family N-acetyltransferase n=1 Tax=Deinococcus arboris TaxID=2682977 RepID=UPI001E55F805|nr:GNAT family N-acetyltransferase [Deinococcus arboris]
MIDRRPVTPADGAVIARHRLPDPADAPDRPAYAAWVAGAIARGTYLGFVTQVGGEIIAGAGLTLLDWGPSRGDPQPLRARVVNVWTHPDWRRQGHARALVQACLAAGQARGVTRFALGTTLQGRALYEALGFAASGTEMTAHLPAPPAR